MEFLFQSPLATGAAIIVVALLAVALILLTTRYAVAQMLRGARLAKATGAQAPTITTIGLGRVEWDQSKKIYTFGPQSIEEIETRLADLVRDRKLHPVVGGGVLRFIADGEKDVETRMREVGMQLGNIPVVAEMTVADAISMAQKMAIRESTDALHAISVAITENSGPLGENFVVAGISLKTIRLPDEHSGVVEKEASIQWAQL